MAGMRSNDNSGLAASKNCSHVARLGSYEEFKTMFAWRSLDPKISAEVVRILAQRLSRRPSPPMPRAAFSGVCAIAGTAGGLKMGPLRCHHPRLCVDGRRDDPPRAWRPRPQREY